MVLVEHEQENIIWKGTQTVFNFPAHLLKRFWGIYHPSKKKEKRKSSNLAKEGQVGEKSEAPIMSNYHVSLSTWWNDLMPFRR